MNKKFTTCLIFLVVLILVAIIFSIGMLILVNTKQDHEDNPSEETLKHHEIKRFASAEDFKSYLQKAENKDYSGTSFSSPQRNDAAIEEEATPSGMGDTTSSDQKSERYSQTNVQVEGIDEPDIVKTDGKNIFYSQEMYYYYLEEPVLIDDVKAETSSSVAPDRTEPKTKLISAFPIEDLQKQAEVNETGDLLLYKNILIIFDTDKITAYNVSDVKGPQFAWSYDITEKSQLAGARLMGDKLYLVFQTNINRTTPCPVGVLESDEKNVNVVCTDIYYPEVYVPTDITYSVIILSAEAGELKDTVSFIGSSSYSVMYMSENSIYLTYSYTKDFFDVLIDFIDTKAQDLFSDEVIGKIRDLKSYDISNQAKMTELGVIMEQYFESLTDDEQTKVQNELQKRLEEYYKEHQRDIERTGIVKIDTENLDLQANGSVSGSPLNQFSLDEYNGNVRIATTVGNLMWGWDESVSDVYVLNDNLVQIGAVTDLGKGERIYSARFVGDKGYVVTFKQIDPFYVLDLSDAQNPQLKGELKIPGYSSYLHPISENTVLGIGMEDWGVKASLFDVGDPSQPKEISKVELDEYWSDVNNNHHAFLLDTKHEVFFMPAGSKGYVFSYKDNQLKEVAKIEDFTAKRAVYIDDYMYILGEEKVVVIDETTWQQVKELSL